MWGPVVRHETMMEQVPPLFGNRRQGPDLLNVGNRRSRAWLKRHFEEPTSVRAGSVMPSYRHLFSDDRGDALLDYLSSLGGGTAGNRYATMNAWEPSPGAAVAEASGARLFEAHCGSCHDAALVRDPGGWVRKAFRRPPTDLAAGPMVYAPPGMEAGARRLRLARIIKFGLPGTDMPGHEYLSDSEIVSLAGFVADVGAGAKP
jgi:cytochrome c oxidase cbb3-type subunit 2